jgi:WhiB family redox-sensing transcriptional regulator
MDPDLFFPVGTTGPALLQIEAAKAVCRQCDVSQECLQYAIDSNQEYGIWGGLTEEERRYMRRELTARVSR